MGEKIEDGGSAFPYQHNHRYAVGMSLRDWFAGQANEEDIRANMNFGDSCTLLIDRVAARYRFSDAMLVERSREKR